MSESKPGFRPAMTWLHSWAGLVLGLLLMTIWWTGTLSVFDKEIDRWMQPETRIAAPEQRISADAIVERVLTERPDGTLSSLLIYLPEERVPFYEVHAEFENAESYRGRLHPGTGEELGDEVSLAASGFLYPMHYRLHSGAVGYIAVALATFMMMVLLVTGVVIHRKIFTDFFTFRANRKSRRSTLDLHNVTGTIFLPFHFLICLSGFAIFAGWYASIPLSFVQLADPENRAVELFYAADNDAYYSREAAGEPAEMLAMAPMVAQAETIWRDRYGVEAKADRIDVTHYGDANAVVEVRRHFPSNRTEAHRDSINFDGATGAVLTNFEASPLRKTRTWLEGFHQVRFDHWPIRWLYLVAGLSGCVLIGTGFLFWAASRRRKEAAQPFKVRLVDTIAVGSITGLVLATGAFLVVNRVLPLDAAALGIERAGLEVRCFFYVWLLTFVHAAIRKQRAWMEQCRAIAVLAVSAVALNWLTTGDHLLAAIGKDLWPIVGVDLSLLSTALIAALAAGRLRSKMRQVEEAAVATHRRDMGSPSGAAGTVANRAE